MSDKIREAFDAWIASVDKRRDANGWEPLTARDVSMLREGYMEAAITQQAATAVPDALPYWAPCNPACDPELNGLRSKLCDCDQAKEALTTPAAPVAQEPVAWMKLDGSDVWSDAKKRLAAARAGSPGAIVAELYSLPLYAAPPAAEQPECPTCSGHGLVGNRLDDGEECPECHGACIIFGTECGARAEQPDTVAVPREDAQELLDALLKAQMFKLATKLRALLAGGAE